MISSAIAFVCLAHSSELSAKDVFKQTMDSYSKLDSFSTDIEHDFSSGLFPGKYKQHLDFKKNKGFRLVVSDLKSGDGRDKIAPDYYCDGSDVTSVGRSEGTHPINKDSNSTPGYEVSGGMIVTWLLDSPTKGFFSNPPEGMKIDVKWGSRKSWHDEKVEEIIFQMSDGTHSASVSVFIDSEHKHLIGNEAMNNGKLGFMLYRNQKDNPAVNRTTFKPPK